MEQSNTQQSVGEEIKDHSLNNTSENTLSTWIRKIEGTVFSMRYMEGHGYAYGIGNERVSKWFETEKELEEDLQKNDWDVIIRVMDCLMRHHDMAKELERRVENVNN